MDAEIKLKEDENKCLSLLLLLFTIYFFKLSINWLWAGLRAQAE